MTSSNDDYQHKLHTIRMSHLYEDARVSTGATINFASGGVRSLFLVHGGALIALLTFVGNAGYEKATLSGLQSAFFLFGGGLFFALTAAFGAYFAQALATLSSTYDAEFIYFNQTGSSEISREMEKKADRERFRSNAVRITAVVSAVISGFTFPAGVFVAANALVVA